MLNKNILKKEELKIGFKVLVLIALISISTSCLEEGERTLEDELKNLPKKDRAFLQQDLADLVIDFYSWDDISCSKPDVKRAKYKTRLKKEELLKILRKINNRYLAVVIMDKRLLLEDKRLFLNQNIETIETFLKEQGFKKIIFQQGQNDWCETGLPIIKE